MTEASTEGVVKLVHDTGAAPTRGEMDGALATIQYIRDALDRLERTLAAHRIVTHDDTHNDDW
jgi:hypothetical protein